jgi:thioredoxin 1
MQWKLTSKNSLSLPKSQIMELIEIQYESELMQAIRTGVVLLDFNAPWCSPCLMQKQILKNIARRFKNRASILTINIDNHQNLASEKGIKSIPTILIFKNSSEVIRFVGLQDESTIFNALLKIVD